MNPYPSSQGDAHLLVSVLGYLKKKNGSSSRSVSKNPLMQSIASAAAGIIASAEHGTRFLDEAGLTSTLHEWASGLIQPNYVALPQLTAATLLWADTFKNGS